MDPDIEALIAGEVTPQQAPLQPTQQQKVEAYEAALAMQEASADQDHDWGIERMMVHVQDHDITQRQIQQIRDRRHRDTTVENDPDPQVQWYQQIMAHMDDYEAWTDQQERERLRQLQAEQWAEALRAFGIPIAQVTESFRSLIQAFGSVVEDVGDAIIAAFAPLQDLLDQMEAPPSQPVCPSHGRTLKGGACPTCQRRAMRHTRNTGR